MKVICIKSYNAPCGHATINHISGNVYELRELLDGNFTIIFTIIDEYNREYFWDKDMISEYFKSIKDIREEKLISLGI